MLGQEQIKFLSPNTLSTRLTGAQYLSARKEATGHTACSLL